MKRYYILFVLILCYLCTIAQNVTVSAPRVVTEGEQFRMAISVDADPSKVAFSPPSLSNFTILAGPSTSTMQGVETINGKTSYSRSVTYTYILQAGKEGKYDLGTASFEIDGKSHNSQKIQIEVVKGDANTSQSNNSRDQQSSTNVSDNDLFVRTHISKASAYRGEYLLATVKLYTKTLNIARFEDVKFPTFNGFWNQEIETPQQLEFQRENVNGTLYNSVILRRYVLFPQQTGELVIEPFEVTCVLQIRGTSTSRNVFDSFFDTPQVVRKKITSPVSRVQIKPLPAGAPSSFSGAVGTNYKMEASFQRDTLVANDAVSLVIKISGEGNLQLIEAPKAGFPVHFEVYDTKITDNARTSSSGVSGSKQFEIPVIPRSAGQFQINPVEFSYFEVNKGQYVILKSTDFLLRIGKDPNAGNAVTMQGVNRQSIQALGEDIRYIKTTALRLHEKGKTFFNSWTFYLLGVLQIVIFIATYICLRRYRKQSLDVVLVRNKKANKIARKRLKTANNLQQAGDSSGFYEELTRALWDYLGNKLIIDVADLSRERAYEALQKRNAPQKDIDAFLQIVDECEFARYAPGQGQGQLHKIYKEAIDVISRFEQTLK